MGEFFETLSNDDQRASIYDPLMKRQSLHSRFFDKNNLLKLENKDKRKNSFEFAELSESKINLTNKSFREKRLRKINDDKQIKLNPQSNSFAADKASDFFEQVASQQRLTFIRSRRYRALSIIVDIPITLKENESNKEAKS